MPQPLFQPVIGSGFDADAAQQFQWANFNRGVDEANIARAEQANREYNNWLATVAQMNRFDAAQQNQWGREDFGIATRANTIARQEAEAKRQFDVNLQAQRESQKEREQFQREQFDKQLELAKTEEDKQKQVIRNFGENYVDNVKEAAGRYEDVTKQYQDAMNDVLTLGQKKASEVGDSNWTYDARQQKLVPLNPRIPADPKVKAKVDAANEEISQKVSSYSWLRDLHADVERNWNTVQQTASKNSFIIKGQGKDAYLHSPMLGESFGQMVKEAKAREIPNYQPEWTPPTTATASVVPPEGITPKVTVLNHPFTIAAQVGARPAIAPVAAVPPVVPVAPAVVRNPWPAQEPEPVAPAFAVPSPVATNAAVGRVRVISPTGKRGSIPADQLPVALASGFRLESPND